MGSSGFELVTLKGGERSVRSLEHGETMHIGSGPRSEALALHVGPQRLAERAAEFAAAGKAFVIWDVGLGAAGNALTAIETLRDAGAPAEFHSFEIATELLEFALRHSKELGYLAGWETAVGNLLAKGAAEPVAGIRWQLHRGDFGIEMALAPAPCAIFHDPYSPAKNPAMYSLETFKAMRQCASGADAPPCLLTNYTRSTSVRVALALAGWQVGLGAATGEKEQTTVAANLPGLLERPLDCEWLTRVRRSTGAAPIRGDLHRPSPITEEDYCRLSQMPQFNGCPASKDNGAGPERAASPQVAI